MSSDLDTMTTRLHPVLAPHPAIGGHYDGAESKRKFIRGIFDDTAGDYDRIERMMALGSGPWYRRAALKRAGLATGMRVLDVAAGTGLVAREAVRLAGGSARVIGVDPSIGMLKHGLRSVGITGVMGVGEQLPMAEEVFDFVSMGYALRHLVDLNAAFGEFWRVLRPGGRVCILEITRPRNRIGRALLRGYMRTVVPMLARVRGARSDSKWLWEYYWDTIEQCVDGERVMQCMRACGFDEVKRHAELGIFSEFTGRKPQRSQGEANRSA
jgi:demethylmenaquinone methyltransferase/2-methoxy-6-polyprenyl-1,4-benzoquinol methylase